MFPEFQLDRLLDAAEVITCTKDLDKDAWLNHRRTGIGGSDVAPIMEISPFSTARDIYFDKLNINPRTFEQNEIAKMVGTALEDIVAYIFAKKTGFKVYKLPYMFRSKKYPFMLADIDFIIEMPNGKLAILETKTTSFRNMHAWKDSVPYYYEVQGRHYAIVLDFDVVYFACLYGNNENDFVHYKIERDKSEDIKIIMNNDYFWNYHVKTRTPPPLNKINGKLALQSVLRTPLNNKASDVYKFPKKHEKTLRQYQEVLECKEGLNTEIKKLKNKEDILNAQLLEILSNHSVAEFILDGKPIYLYKKENKIPKIQIKEGNEYNYSIKSKGA